VESEVILPPVFWETIPNTNPNHNEGPQLSTSLQSQMVNNFAKKASSANTLREMQRDLLASLARLSKDEDDSDQISTVLHNSMQSQLERPMLSNLAVASPLAMTPSASRKLYYIIEEVIYRIIILITYLIFYY
jgi:hypothetical protein